MGVGCDVDAAGALGVVDAVLMNVEGGLVGDDHVATLGDGSLDDVEGGHHGGGDALDGGFRGVPVRRVSTVFGNHGTPMLALMRVMTSPAVSWVAGGV